MSYSPEWLLSAFRIKMMVSFSVLRMLIWFLSIGEPFFCHDTFALGLPCKKPGNNLYMLFREKRVLVTKGKLSWKEQWEYIFESYRISDAIPLIYLKCNFFLSSFEWKGKHLQKAQEDTQGKSNFFTCRRIHSTYIPYPQTTQPKASSPDSSQHSGSL